MRRRENDKKMIRLSDMDYSISEESHRTFISFYDINGVELKLDEKYRFFKNHHGENPDETDTVSYHRIGGKGDVYVNILIHKKIVHAWSANKDSLKNLLINELGLPDPFVINQNQKR